MHGAAAAVDGALAHDAAARRVLGEDQRLAAAAAPAQSARMPQLPGSTS